MATGLAIYIIAVEQMLDGLICQSISNCAQLLFRTMNQDTHEPHPNQDYLAALLRDQLMPIRCAAASRRRRCGAPRWLCEVILVQYICSAEASWDGPRAWVVMPLQPSDGAQQQLRGLSLLMMGHLLMLRSRGLVNWLMPPCIRLYKVKSDPHLVATRM